MFSRVLRSLEYRENSTATWQNVPDAVRISWSIHRQLAAGSSVTGGFGLSRFVIPREAYIDGHVDVLDPEIPSILGDLVHDGTDTSNPDDLPQMRGEYATWNNRLRRLSFRAIGFCMTIRDEERITHPWAGVISPGGAKVTMPKLAKSDRPPLQTVPFLIFMQTSHLYSDYMSFEDLGPIS